MSHAVCKTSATNLDPRFKTNSATSVLPSTFCSLENAGNSVYDFFFLATTIRHVHTKTFVFHDYYLCYFFCPRPWLLSSLQSVESWRTDSAPWLPVECGLLANDALVVLGSPSLRSGCPGLSTNSLSCLVTYFQALKQFVWMSEKWTDMPQRCKRNLLLESHRLFLSRLVLRPFENNLHRTLDDLPCIRTSAWFCLVYHKTNTKQPLQMTVVVETAQRPLDYK